MNAAAHPVDVAHLDLIAVPSPTPDVAVAGTASSRRVVGWNSTEDLLGLMGPQLRSLLVAGADALSHRDYRTLIERALGDDTWVGLTRTRDHDGLRSTPEHRPSALLLDTRGVAHLPQFAGPPSLTPDARFVIGNPAGTPAEGVRELLGRGWGVLSLTLESNGMHASLGANAKLCALAGRTPEDRPSRFLPCAGDGVCLYDLDTVELVAPDALAADVVVLRACRTLSFGTANTDPGWTLGARLSAASSVGAVLALAAESPAPQGGEEVTVWVAAQLLAGRPVGAVWADLQRRAPNGELWALHGDPLLCVATSPDVRPDGAPLDPGSVPPGFYSVHSDERQVVEPPTRNAVIATSRYGTVLSNASSTAVALRPAAVPSYPTDPPSHDRYVAVASSLYDTIDLIGWIAFGRPGLERASNEVTRRARWCLGAVLRILRHFDTPAQFEHVDAATYDFQHAALLKHWAELDRVLEVAFSNVVHTVASHLSWFYDDVRPITSTSTSSCRYCSGPCHQVTAGDGSLARVRTVCDTCGLTSDLPDGIDGLLRVDPVAASGTATVEVVLCGPVVGGLSTVQRCRIMWRDQSAPPGPAACSLEASTVAGPAGDELRFDAEIAVPDRPGLWVLTAVVAFSGAVAVLRREVEIAAVVDESATKEVPSR